MKQHEWVVLEGDAGPIGCYDYWECSECKAQGGLARPWHSEDGRPSRAWFRSAIEPLSMDCDEAKVKIAEYIRGEQLEFNFARAK